jgi:hypothetical protein
VSTDLSTCTSSRWLFDNSPYCGEPAIGVSVVGCLHEHVSRRGICAACAADFQQMAGDCTPADPLICTYCDEGPGAHECPVVARIEWVDGTFTVVQDFTGARR